MTETPIDPPIRPALVWGTFALLTLVWGTTWAAIRVGLRGIPPFTGVALRFGISGGVLLLLAPVFRVRFGRARHEKPLWLVLTLLSFCGSYGIVYWAEQWVPSGLAAVLFAVFPLIVGILAHFFLPGERMTWAGGAGALVGFAGVAVIFSEDFRYLGGDDVLRAAAVFLLSPLVSSFAYVATKKWGKDVPPYSLAAMPMVFSGLAMGAFAHVVEGDRSIRWTASSTGALLYLALVGSALTFTLYYWLLSILPATRLALIAYTVPVVAVLFGTVALGEPLTPRILAGSALVVAGVAMASGFRTATA